MSDLRWFQCSECLTKWPSTVHREFRYCVNCGLAKVKEIPAPSAGQHDGGGGRSVQPGVSWCFECRAVWDDIKGDLHQVCPKCGSSLLENGTTAACNLDNRYMPMTKGEQAIWASVFAGFYTSRAGMNYLLEGRTVASAGFAGEAVIALRQLAAKLASDGSETSFFVRSMVNRQEVTRAGEEEVQDVRHWLSHNRFTATLKMFCEEAGLDREEV